MTSGPEPNREPVPSGSSDPNGGRATGKWQTILLRAGLFLLLVILGQLVFPLPFLGLGAYFLAAAVSTFLSGIFANVLVIRIYEKFSPLDIGLRWGPGGQRNLLLGLALGGAAATAVILLLLVTQGASLERASNSFDLKSFAFVSVLLAAGAVGEELMFRGYGFQFLASQIGDYATLIPVGVLFGLAHTGNKEMTTLAFANTIAWGVALGYAFLRSRDLWFPIGLHYAWNLVLVVFGAELSGFTMRVTGLLLKPNPASPWTGGNYGPEGSVLTSAAVVGVFWFLSKAPVARQDTAFAPEPEPPGWEETSAGGDES